MAKVCFMTVGLRDKGDGEYHWYVHEGPYVRCVYCNKTVMEISMTPRWKEYEK
jgi:hypothetical protein